MGFAQTAAVRRSFATGTQATGDIAGAVEGRRRSSLRASVRECQDATIAFFSLPEPCLKSVFFGHFGVIFRHFPSGGVPLEPPGPSWTPRWVPGSIFECFLEAPGVVLGSLLPPLARLGPPSGVPSGPKRAKRPLSAPGAFPRRFG